VTRIAFVFACVIGCAAERAHTQDQSPSPGTTNDPPASSTTDPAAPELPAVSGASNEQRPLPELSAPDAVTPIASIVDAAPTPEASPDAAAPDTAPPDAVPDVSLPPGVVSRFPSAGATVCRDLPLRLSFGNDVRLGNTGRIRIFEQSAPDTAVGTIDMAATSFTDTIAGRTTNLVRPVFVDGRDVSVYFPHALLKPNTGYFVRVDAGVFQDATGAAQGAIDDASWAFRTGPLPPPSNNLVVAREGSGFCTLQGALDASPAGNTARVTVELRNGIYHEIGYLTGKANVTLRGEDRDATVISYPNNENLNGGTAGRAMLTVLTGNGLTIENLTLHNTTPQGGGQAEALRVRSDHVTLRNANFLSLQDTLLLEGHVYVVDSYVEGNVDFVWGVGASYFERSEIKIVGRSGVIVQARNGANAFGYIFVDSRLTADPGITGSTLARIDASVYPNSQVAFINCQIGPQISAAGWTVTPAGTTATGALRFWEFQNTDLAGRPLNTSQRHPTSRQISAAEAASLRDRVAVLGWDPALD
jgi:pectin methylesterase-like acyl-CoA thioesterase